MSDAYTNNKILRDLCSCQGFLFVLVKDHSICFGIILTQQCKPNFSRKGLILFIGPIFVIVEINLVSVVQY